MLTTLRQAYRLIGKDNPGRWALLILVALSVSGLEMVGAVLIFILLNLVVDPGATIELPLVGDLRDLAGDMDQESLLLAVVVVIGVFFLFRAVVTVGAKYVEVRVAYNAGARLSNRLVAGYLNWPYALHLRRNSAELIRNGHQAINELVATVFLPLIKVAAESFLAVGMLTVLMFIAPEATFLAAGIIGGAAMILLFIVQPRLKRIGHTAHDTSQSTLKSLQQALHGVRDIKMLGREKYFAKDYARHRLSFARARYLRATITAIPSVIMELALFGFILLSFGLAVTSGTGSSQVLSTLGLFAYAGMRLQPSLQKIISGINDLKYSTAPLADIYADMTVIESLPRKRREKGRLPFEEELVLSEVSFTYEGAHQPALRDINLVVRPGEQIGICGPTGGGKTTLVDLMTGLLEPTSGEITVDGVDMGQHISGWQRNLGVVPQMVFLLDDTLRRNIALGVADDEIDEEALNRAVDMAQLREFVSSLPGGLETTVGESGVRVSGGQRQRVAIARALYNDPSILVFDEGTSALDNATEAEVMASIDHLRGDHTIVLIAHRLSTVASSDRVFFVEDGRITGEGSYEQLIEGHDAFRAMATGS